jgi:replicative DNA helicase
LNIAQHIATNPRNPKAVAVFSLEMSKESLLTRMLCAAARVDQQKFRAGYLNQEERTRLQESAADMYHAPLFIDDTAGTGLMDIHGKLRRLQAEQDLGLVIVDYLQLMQGPKRENRVQEISSLSRGLKLMSKDLRVPFLVLSQLSRAPETRQGDHRPMLSDLRESGCLTGGARVTLADGQWAEISSLVGRSVDVLAVENWKATTRTAIKVWKTGHRPVLKLTTATGRVIRGTANHPFQCLNRYVPLDSLKVGDRIAVLRRFPAKTSGDMKVERLILLAHMIGDGCCAPRQPIHYTSASEANIESVESAALSAFGIQAKRVRQKNWWHTYLAARASKWHPNPLKLWLRDLGLADKRSYEKFIPAQVFTLPDEKIALFLSHLWATDGSATVNKSGLNGKIYYSTSSRRLAFDVQELLMRLGILSAIRTVQKQRYRLNYHVDISGASDQLSFASKVGIFGDRSESLARLVSVLTRKKANTNRDTIPLAIWADVRAAMKSKNVTTRQMAALRGTAYGGSSHMKFAPSRHLLSDYAAILDCQKLSALSRADVFWDCVKSIEPDGDEDVYDMTVEGAHNFVANGIVVHNSIEQDADMVMFIFREEVYRPDKESLKGVAEILLAKQRNGPTGRVKLAFLNKFTKFENLAHDTGDDETPFE